MVKPEWFLDLSGDDRREIRELSHVVYPHEALANWPGGQLEWSSPEWCVRVLNENGRLVAFVGVYVREAECNGLSVRIGGIGNVMTHPTARRLGHAATGIQRGLEFFFQQQPRIDFALLLCEPSMVSYYSRLGWMEFEGRLLIRQLGEACEFTLERVMTYGIHSSAETSGTIDLSGRPW